MKSSTLSPIATTEAKSEQVIKEVVVTQFPRIIQVPFIIGDTFQTLTGQYKFAGDFRVTEAASVNITTANPSGDFSTRIKALNVGTSGVHLYATKALPRISLHSAIVKLNMLFYSVADCVDVQGQIDLTMNGSPIRHITEQLIINGADGNYIPVSLQLIANLQNISSYSYVNLDFTTTNWYDKAILAGAELYLEEKL